MCGLFFSSSKRIWTGGNHRLILGSTRPGRNGEAVARWVYEVADFENYRVFKPEAHHEKSLNGVIDQVVSWSGALKPLRKK